MILQSQIATCEHHGAYLRSPKGCPACPSKQGKEGIQEPRGSVLAALATMPPQTGQPKPRRGKQMNQTEGRFLARLKDMRCFSQIDFEGAKLRIGENCYYAPDFMCVVADGNSTVKFFEVKGAHIWDDSKVKFKAAKERYPHWSFECWQWKNKEWRQIL